MHEAGWIDLIGVSDGVQAMDEREETGAEALIVDAGIKRQHFRRFCSQEKNQPSARMQYTRYSSF